MKHANQLLAAGAVLLSAFAAAADEAPRDYKVLSVLGHSEARPDEEGVVRYKAGVYSALLQSVDDGALAQCSFVTAAAPEGDQDKLAIMSRDLYVQWVMNRQALKQNEDAPHLMDILRPSKAGIENNKGTFGSCVPYESELPPEVMEMLEKGVDVKSLNVYMHGQYIFEFGDPAQTDVKKQLNGGAIGYIWRDNVRNERLKKEGGAGNVMRDAYYNDLYIGANPEACDHTGDIGMLRAIVDAYETKPDKIVTGVRLRANCPQ